MICKNCNTENLDGAIFCKTCGSRIDGKKICPTCNFANEESDTFCAKCGSRIDGKKFCSNCGNEVVGVFCTTCGQKYSPKKTSVVKPNGEKSGSLSPIAKILDIAGNSVLMLGVVLSLIFIFFIGIGSDLTNENSIFYYFGKAYKDLKLLYDGTGYYSASLEISSYVSTVILTCVIGISLIGCAIFSILAIVNFVKKLCFGGEKSPALYSLLSISFYLVCAITFKNAFFVTATGVLEEFGTALDAIKLNGATTTGIILTVISALVYYAITIVSKALTLRKNKILTFVLSIATTALLVVVFVLTSNAHVTLSFNYQEGLTSYKGSVIASFTVFATTLSTMSYSIEIIGAVILSACIEIIYITTLFMLLVAISNTILNEKTDLVLAILTVITLLVNMILSLITINLFADFIVDIGGLGISNVDKYLSISCPLAIVSFILSVIALVINIVKSVTASKMIDYEN